MEDKPNLLISLAIFWDFSYQDGLRFWMQTRGGRGHLEGKLEFPGGKVESGESLEEAMRREVLEETEYEISDKNPVKFFKVYAHDYEQVRVVLNAFLVGADRPEVQPEKGVWFDLKSEAQVDELEGTIPPANHQILKDLFERLGKLNLEERKFILWN